MRQLFWRPDSHSGAGVSPLQSAFLGIHTTIWTGDVSAVEGILGIHTSNTDRGYLRPRGVVLMCPALGRAMLCNIAGLRSL